MNDNQFSGGMLGTIITALGASLSATDIQAIISIIVTVIGFLITLTNSVIIPAFKKWRDIRRDGKVTNEELDEFSETLNSGLNDLKNQGKEGK